MFSIKNNEYSLLLYICIYILNAQSKVRIIFSSCSQSQLQYKNGRFQLIFILVLNATYFWSRLLYESISLQFANSSLICKIAFYLYYAYKKDTNIIKLFCCFYNCIETSFSQLQNILLR